MAPFIIIKSLLGIPHSVFRTHDISNTQTVLTRTSRQKGKAGSVSALPTQGRIQGECPDYAGAGCRALATAGFLRLSVRNCSQTKQNLLLGGWA